MFFGASSLSAVKLVLSKSVRVMFFFCVDLTWNDPYSKGHVTELGAYANMTINE